MLDFQLNRAHSCKQCLINYCHCYVGVYYVPVTVVMKLYIIAQYPAADEQYNFVDD